MSRDTEALLVCACLKAGDLSRPLRYGIDGKRFTECGEALVWALKWFHEHNYVPSLSLLLAQFPDFPVSDVQGTEEEVEVLCHKIREDWTRADLTGTAKVIVEQLRDKTPPNEVLAEVKRRVDGMSFSAETRVTEIVNDWELAYQELQKRQAMEEERGSSGVPTGFLTLDQVAGGFHGGEYWVFAGRLGEGKTWSLIRMACHAVANGLKVQFHALEQTRAQIQLRCLPFLARHANHELPSTRDVQAFYQGFAKVAEVTTGQMVVDDSPRQNVTAATISAQIETNKPDVVFVDYLGLLSQRGGEWQEIAKLSGEIKSVAMAYEIPVVVAAQINRQGEGGLPQPVNLSGSDAIGQDADGVVTMKYSPKGGKVLEMGLQKYRHGQDGMRWYCEFLPEKGVFDEVSGDRAQELMREVRTPN